MTDKLDQQIIEEMKRFGIPVSGYMVRFMRNQYEANLTLRRIFEPVSDKTFVAGDKVELVRPFFGLAVGLIGTVKSVETNINPDGAWKEEWEVSADYLKGHPYLVEFDCTHIPLDAEEQHAMEEFCKRHGIDDVPTTRGRTQTNVSGHDIRKVE